MVTVRPRKLTPKLNIIIGPPKRKKKLFWDHAVFINLDYRTDRLEHMKKELKFIGIEAERISGIREKNKDYRRPYAYGCKMSHMKCLDIMENNNYEKMLILEDDAVFHNDFWDILNKVIEQIKDINWDVLFLGAKAQRYKRVSENLIQLLKSVGTQAYIVNRKAIPILRLTLNDYRAVDNSYSTLYRDKLQAYRVNPTLISQIQSKSSIHNRGKIKLPQEFIH